MIEPLLSVDDGVCLCSSEPEFEHTQMLWLKGSHQLTRSVSTFSAAHPVSECCLGRRRVGCDEYCADALRRDYSWSNQDRVEGKEKSSAVPGLGSLGARRGRLLLQFTLSIRTLLPSTTFIPWLNGYPTGNLPKGGEGGSLKNRLYCS